jgi:predicted O-linked N-acetylglucosamine transferase (SPINDLY family)
MAEPKEPLTRQALGLPGDRVAAVSCQSLFKHLPQNDHIYPAMAREAPELLFVFLKHLPEMNRAFAARLKRAFAAQGLDMADHCLLLDRTPPDRFPGLLAACDLYLDTPGWSGGNTTLEAAAAGLPVLTTPAGPMRGRHSAAILTRLGLTETLAPDLDGFCQLAVSLARDSERRKRLARETRRLEHRLYNDLEPVRALEDVLEREIGQRLG